MVFWFFRRKCQHVMTQTSCRLQLGITIYIDFVLIIINLFIRCFLYTCIYLVYLMDIVQGEPQVGQDLVVAKSCLFCK